MFFLSFCSSIVPSLVPLLAPTAWRADSHQSYRWPDEANKPTRELLRDCKESEVLAKDLAAIIRPACVAQCVSPRGWP